MSDSTTVARPYAKAIFEFALENSVLTDWSKILNALSSAASTEEALSFISNPSAKDSQLVDLFLDVYTKTCKDKQGQSVENLLRLMVKNKRLNLLPEITQQFDAFKAEQEKTINVNIITFSPLSKEQSQQLEKKLSQRLNRDVVLHTSIDESILGGAIIRAGDTVIDGSVRNKLNKLIAGIAA